VERFAREVANSPVFARLPRDWEERCEVVSADLASPRATLGLPRATTHILHCAAAAAQSGSLARALAANVTPALRLLEFAEGCPGPVRLVSLSSAYVAPHPGGGVYPVPEALISLEERPLAALLDGALGQGGPSLPEALYQRLLAAFPEPTSEGDPHELRWRQRLLRASGHPNLYTFTLWLAEQLLAERASKVPVALIRPSMVSACWKEPVSGWVDGRSPFSRFVALAGSGRLERMVARPETLLDVVPCDRVAQTLVDEAFSSVAGAPSVTVRHVVAGRDRCLTVAQTCEAVVEFFQGRTAGAELRVRFTPPPRRADGPVPRGRTAEALGRLSKAVVRRAPPLGRGRAPLRQQLLKLDEASAYFTTHSFDFASAEAPGLQAPAPRRYLRTICRGVFRHRLRGDDSQLSLAGRLHREGRSDLLFTARQPSGNPVIRGAAYLVQKALRRAADRVTFDKAAFDEALADRPEGALLVLVPSHRSFMDFVICSYLFFARSDLGIAIPHIAAAEEFQRIAVLGRLFPYAHAFYVKRGQGKADQSLTRQVHALVNKGCTLQFFIEGARSRSRRFLPPRRGMLRALQATGQPCVLLPVALTYDRVPDEALLLRELQGLPRPPFELRALLGWLGRVARGQVRLGRFHIGCGPLLPLEQGTDVVALSLRVIEELGRHTATTTHHLRAFVVANPALKLDVAWLRREIERRGGRVLDSPLRGEEALPPLAERCLRNNWLHHFYPEAQALYGNDPAVTAHLRRNGYGVVPELSSTGATALAVGGEPLHPDLEALIRALFEPIRRDIRATWAWVRQRPPQQAPATPRDVLRALPELYLPDVEDALADVAPASVAETAGGPPMAATPPWAKPLGAAGALS
jgi:1-acyl-sn-glycerol-3-phosphate acyltransferase